MGEAIKTSIDPDCRSAASQRIEAIRLQSGALAKPLLPEDQVVQSMPDVSPTKWHLAHTSWFFETFVLLPFGAVDQIFQPAFNYLFNSYYEAIGPRHARAARGLITRPSVSEVAGYRAHVTGALLRFAEIADAAVWEEAAPLIELGLQHEQQHQELLLMDIKHVLSANPIEPAYHAPQLRARLSETATSWTAFEGGLIEIGHHGSGFAFDNEGPQHKVWLDPYRLQDRLITCGEYLAFIEDNGYRRPELWLSDGWAAVKTQEWEAPLYWAEGEGGWTLFTHEGRRAIDPAEPVVHVSHYEADAFARWAGKRLPSEAEWEHAAMSIASVGSISDHSAERGIYQPLPAETGLGLRQMFGDCWEWTGSAYIPYPGFRSAAGAVGEYNGKFMSGQMVLRGGACVTPAGHTRPTYRNFFPPSARWCYGGIRLAEEIV